MEKHILITNDDGIESGFLRTLARTLQEKFRISIAAPASEQSWIGRAVSRTGTISVEEHKDFDCQAWTIGGTPTDCVNIALGNLMDELPDAVVSGINIGYNTSTPLIYSSGTVAGAIEGAFWGLPAFAISQQVPDEIFFQVADARGLLPDPYQAILEANARHATDLVERILHRPKPAASDTGRGVIQPNRDAIVHNFNYPIRPEQPYKTVLTVPVPLREMSFYKKDENGDYSFHFQHGTPLPCDQKTDREAIDEGLVSHSILNFSALGRELNH